ncbi:MAG: helix-turn-helix transcriptional regulator [Bacteroidia bacterium]|nr:helix-turn-helix transcriptional regulator [Bacteroidia bacterium]
MTDIDKDIKEILQQIKDARQAKNLSQAEVARYLGINQNSYKNIETGKTELKVRVLFQLIDLLDIDVLEKKSITSFAVDESTIREIREDLKHIKDKLGKKEKE